MSKGAILFAFNSPKYDYFSMAESTAKRINHFLNLPVTVVTDKNSIPKYSTDAFDRVVLAKPDKNNIRDHSIWINKGRYQAYELSPYEETLLIDVDYMVNSDKLLKTFEIKNDFCCHDTTSFLMQPKLSQEMLSAYSYKTLWATVVNFKKTSRAKHIFECLEMVQKNYEHYANIHNFIGGIYRNDYALTLALRIANGHKIKNEDIIPWNLLHVGKNTTISKNNNHEFNTEYTVTFDNWQKGKIRKEYMIIKDMDFHVINKDNFVKLIQ